VEVSMLIHVIIKEQVVVSSGVFFAEPVDSYTLAGKKTQL